MSNSGEGKHSFKSTESSVRLEKDRNSKTDGGREREKVGSRGARETERGWGKDKQMLQS